MSSSRRHALVLLAVALVVPLVVSADVLQDLGATFEQVAQVLASAFPKVETRIVAVDGREVRLAGAGVGSLRPGLELVAYRKGAPFLHPITGQPLGHAEDEVAVLVVTAVTETEATARVATTEGGRVPEVGDGARITAGRIPVAVLPTAGINVPGETAEQTALLLVSRLSALLEKTGRFLAVEPRRVLDVAAPPTGTPPSALEVAQRLRAPAVVVTRLVQDGRTRELETSWVSARTGATLVSSRLPVARASFPPRFAWEQTPELERTYALDGQVRGVALADVDGDGRPELVVADERTVTVRRWQDGTLVPVGGAEFRPTGLVLSVDAAALNGAGASQIVVVEQRNVGETVHSTVLELQGGRLRPIYEASDRFLRVISVDAEPWLVEQAVGQAEPFDSTIRRLVWRDGRYREAASLRVPKDVTVYGLALMRLTGSPEPDVVALTGEDRLAVWTARGRRIWISGEPYGGPVVTFPVPSVERRDQHILIGRIRGRVLAVPGAAEGPEILVFENEFPVVGGARTLFPGIAPSFFTHGRIHRLRWNDGQFRSVWQSRMADGYITDFAYGQVDAEGRPNVIVGVVPRGLNLETLNPLGASKSQLVLYELP